MSANLGELISGIKHAIVNAHRSVGTQHMQELAQFFEYDGEQSPPPAFPSGNWRPRTVQISVPKEVSQNGKVTLQNHLIQVPLITLIPMRSYVIDRAEILTRVNLGLADQPESLLKSINPSEATAATEHSDWHPNKQPTVTVQMGAADEQSAELKIIVHGLDIPVGLQRLVEAYDKLLNAQLPT